MADIELVIKFEEFKFEALKNEELYNTFPKEMKVWGLEAIRNGVLLPKGHGRLKDVDWIDDNCDNHYSDKDGSWCYAWRDIDDAPTIIEANKERKE